MKKLFTFTGILLLVSILLGCTMEPGKTETGTLVLHFPLEESKTLVPGINMEPVSYDINGMGANGASFSTTSDQAIVEISSLDFGEWTITVDAKNIDETIIGSGTEVCTVHAGETTIVTITVLPLDGTGTIDLTVNWTATDTEYPSIESQLIPATGGPVELGFTITGGNQGTYVNNSISTGFHTLIVQLMDGNPANITPILTMGAVEVVRVVKDEITSGTFDFTEINRPGGIIQVHIDARMNDPIEVSLSGQQEIIGSSGSMTVTASVPVETGNVVYVWYINGKSVGTGESYTVSGLDPGVYRLDVTAFTPDGSRAGSATYDFHVAELNVVEFFDDFESYNIGYNPTDIYDYYCIPWTSGDLTLPDMFEVGMIETNKVLQFHYPGPSYHFPGVHKIYKTEFSQIHEAAFTHYFTEPSVGWIVLKFEYQDDGSGYNIQTDYGNHFGIYSTASGELGHIQLWDDKVIIDMSHRIHAKRVGNRIIATVTRLDTNEQKTLEVESNEYTGGKAGFVLKGDWSGGTYINVDDFYVKGIPAQ